MKNRFRPNKGARLALTVLAAGLWAGAGHAVEPLSDAPIRWHESDRAPIPRPAERDPSLAKDFYESSISRPFTRHLDPDPLSLKIGGIFGGEHARPALNVNALDEVPSSSWFTNRIGIFPMTPEEVRRGPGETGPDRSAPWTVVGGKAEGVTPGLQIKDATGARFLLKFDPPGYEGMTIAAGAISVALFHAAGYNVPEDVVVDFERADLVLGEDVEIEIEGVERAMTEADIDTLLGRVKQFQEGEWRGLASRFLSGRPVGPFDYKGRRKDDPNDRVDHEDRRELRGLRMMAAWVNHFDTKQDNTLDMFIAGEDGNGYVRHNLIDFASTLGSGGRGPVRMFGNEYAIDFANITGRTMALGLYENEWRRLERPDGLDEVGYLPYENFDPMAFKPQQPNTAFSQLTRRDGYWAAKIISSFQDAHVDAAVSRGRYRNPAAAEYIATALKGRRDALVRYWFDRVPPLEFFALEGTRLSFHDIGKERGYYSRVNDITKYRVRVAAVDSERDPERWSDWWLLPHPAVDLNTETLAVALQDVSMEERPFLAVELQVTRNEEWSRSVVAYFSRSQDRIVAVDR